MDWTSSWFLSWIKIHLAVQSANPITPVTIFSTITSFLLQSLMCIVETILVLISLVCSEVSDLKISRSFLRPAFSFFFSQYQYLPFHIFYFFGMRRFC